MAGQWLDRIWCLVLRRRDKSITSLCPFAPSDKIRQVTLAVWIESLYFSCLLFWICWVFPPQSFRQSMPFLPSSSSHFNDLFSVVLRHRAALFLKCLLFPHIFCINFNFSNYTHAWPGESLCLTPLPIYFKWIKNGGIQQSVSEIISFHGHLADRTVASPQTLLSALELLSLPGYIKLSGWFSGIQSRPITHWHTHACAHADSIQNSCILVCTASL